MKQYLKHRLTQLIRKLVPEIQDIPEIHSRIRGIESEMYNQQIAQTQLLLHYQQLLHRALPLPKFEDTGFRVYSQNGEDGLLLYLFALIGTTNRVCLDVAFGSPFCSNTTNLLCNWGWHGLLIEENERLVEEAKTFFASHPDTLLFPPKVIKVHVTAEKFNDLLEAHGVIGEIDLFSLDVDGVDYWLWNALEAVQPRVVIVEYQDIWGPEKAVTVPYSPDFNRLDTHPDYCGASLLAFAKLGRKKGYRLVGCNRYGFNAFFVRHDIGNDIFPEISIHQCFQHPKVQHGRQNRLPEVMNYEWVEV